MLSNDSPTVLVADDNEDDRAITIRFIRKAAPNAHIITCKDGEEALRCLLEYVDRDRDEMPHLALMDMKMPKLNGDEVAAQLQNEPNLSRIPLVLFSSSALADDVDRCIRAGVRSYVRKPTDFYEYETVVRRLCEYWLEVNLDLRVALTP